MNCLRHELCLTAHWLPFNSWRRRHADEKSWRSQFMMLRHQFIYKNEQSKNRRKCILLLSLFFAITLNCLACGTHLCSPFGEQRVKSCFAGCIPLAVSCVTWRVRPPSSNNPAKRDVIHFRRCENGCEKWKNNGRAVILHHKMCR